MVKRKFDMNQTKLGVKTLDWHVLKDYILCFVVEFIEKVFPILEINEPKKKWRDYFLFDVKLIVYTKILHIGKILIIMNKEMYHEIFRYICDDIRLSEKPNKNPRKQNQKIHKTKKEEIINYLNMF